MKTDRSEALNVAWRHGMALFPLARNAKTPAAGFKWRDGSTTDPDQWRRWFTDPGVNIGVDCGKSRIVVIDVDPRHDGYASIAKLISLGYTIPTTLAQTTRSDGVHYLMRSPSWELSNTAGRLPGVDVPLTGVDLRGVGGYIVYASSSMDGSTWVLQNPDADLADCPPWLRPPVRKPVTLSTSDVADLSGAYIAAALRDEARRVSDAVPGTRNDTLVRAAFNLGQLVSESTLTERMITGVLLEAAHTAGLVASDGLRSAEQTIRSGLAAGVSTPRKIGAR